MSISCTDMYIVFWKLLLIIYWELLSMKPKLKTLEWVILNPNQLINLEINNKRRKSII